LKRFNIHRVNQQFNFNLQQFQTMIFADGEWVLLHIPFCLKIGLSGTVINLAGGHKLLILLIAVPVLVVMIIININSGK